MRVLEETDALFMIVAGVLVGLGQNTYLGTCRQNEFGRHSCSQLPVMLGYNTLVW